MDARSVRCKNGSLWKVMAVGRSSPERLELVFESLDQPGQLLRGEVAAAQLGDLSDDELCFLIEEHGS
ncbi:MAG: hypothetical protein JSU87_05260 [Gemmatimonadota bacterium]|nr:MAG: hypothetical protein JSU87_05260 [Gemmatimonadota bacterium]